MDFLKKLRLYALVRIFLITSVLPKNIVLANISSSSLGLQVKYVNAEKTIARTVGLGYVDLWKTSGGVWHNGYKPGGNYTLPFRYDFSFGRKVKSVKVFNFDKSSEQQRLWDEVRSVPYADVKASIPSQKTTSLVSSTGIGTKSITLDVSMNVTLDADEPIITATPEHIAAGQLGYRYYLPLIIEVEFEEDYFDLTTQHFNLDNGQRLDTDNVDKILSGTEVAISKRDFPDLKYAYYVYSLDGGKTWSAQKPYDTCTIKVTKNTIVRFYYSKNSMDKLSAKLSLTADPSALKKGQTGNVNFKLEAVDVQHANPITSYEFLFGDSEDNLTSISKGVSSSASTSKSNVSAGDKFYGKLIVTDNKGNTAESVATVTIAELPGDASDVKIKAKIDSITFTEYDNPDDMYFTNSVHLADYIERVDFYLSNNPEVVVYLKNDKEFVDLINSTEGAVGHFTLGVDGGSSYSTNGIGEYKFSWNSYNSMSQTSTSPSVKFNGASGHGNSARISSAMLKAIYRGDGKSWRSTLSLEVSDSVYPNVKDMASVAVEFRMQPLPPQQPEVTLDINAPEFIRESTGVFTATYTENDSIITNKRWEVVGLQSDYVNSGNGDITGNYVMSMPTGDYKATQYIEYMWEGNMTEGSAEVTFKVVNRKKPTVVISTSTPKVVLPGDVSTNVTITEGGEHYPVKDKWWTITDEQGNVIMQGSGVIPSKVPLDITLQPGYITITEYIKWDEYGEDFTDSDSVDVKLISPISTPIVTASMQMSHDLNNMVWQPVSTVQVEYGKQYKRIRLDLIDSIEYNKKLENPYNILFNDKRTAIQIVPLDNNLSADYSRLDKIVFADNSNVTRASTYVEISGVQFTDVRFDEPGRYRVKARVHNDGGYTSSFVIKDIYIREDLGGTATITFPNLTLNNGQYTDFRDTSNLHVNIDFNITTNVLDEDSVDNSTAKVKISYDANYDGSVDNDGVYSTMNFTRSYNSLSPVVYNVTKDFVRNRFSVDFFENATPVLGKIRFDYVASKDPVIPYFTGGSLPEINYPIISTYAVADNLKTVYVDNRSGHVKLYLQKEGAIELVIFNYDTTVTNVNNALNSIINKYKGDDNTSVYVVDKNGNKQLMN